MIKNRCAVSQQEANTSFDLSPGPLIRVKLLILSNEEHILLITMHHIISDGWSMDIFFKELSHLYNGYCAGEEPFFIRLPIQYADFALWQRDGFRVRSSISNYLTGNNNFWTYQIFLDFQWINQDPKRSPIRGQPTGYLSKEIKDQLNQLSQNQQTSLFMTLLRPFKFFSIVIRDKGYCGGDSYSQSSL